MKTINAIIERLEAHKGRKLDLSKNRDLQRLFITLNRELEERDSIIRNVQNVLNGQSTYDQKVYKTVLDRNRRK